MSYVGFQNLQAQLQAKGYSAKSAGAITASAGRNKYGAQRMAAAAKSGHSLRGAKVKRRKRKVRRDSRGDTYTPGARFDSAGDRIMGSRDSRGDRLR